MDPLSIAPLEKPVTATVRMPGSKSYTNRALILAALTKGSARLKNPLYSDDTEAMIDCLRALGWMVETHPGEILVQGDIHLLQEKNYYLFARDSGTTIRFMLALLCLVPGVKTIRGNQRLNERPISDLVDALRTLGARIDYCGREGMLPVTISTSSLSGSQVRLKGDKSSQFCSALFLIAPCLAHGLMIHIEGPLISKPYVEMTIGCMREWGVEASLEEDGRCVVSGGQAYRKSEYVIEGDYSSAGYFFAIAALTNSTITLENINPASKQADRKFLELLKQMGSLVTEGENQISVQGNGVLPLQVDMEDCPDQVMTLAVLAAFAKGATHITGVRSLRYKETERVAALKTELGKMGIRTEDTHDTLTIYGGAPHPAEIDTYNDHRMAMAFAVAGMRLKGMVIRHPEVVNKTFPTFWTILESLR